MDYTLERLSESKLSDLAYLIKAIYGREEDLSKLKLKYSTGKWGADYIGYLAYSKEGQPAGYYGVLPIQIMYSGTTYLAAQSGDTMTHPNHRRKGLFTTLAKKTYELAEKEGVQFIFGFPNEYSYPGFVKKLSWGHKHNICTYDFFVPTMPLTEIVKRVSFLKPLYQTYRNFVLSFFEDKTTTFFSGSNEKSEKRVNRDEYFFTYKKGEDKKILTSNHNKIWVKCKDAFFIGDMEFEDEKQLKRNIRKVKWLAFLCGVWRVSCFCSPHSFMNETLSLSNKSRKGLAIGYLNLNFEHPIEDIQFTYADFDTF